MKHIILENTKMWRPWIPLMLNKTRPQRFFFPPPGSWVEPGKHKGLLCQGSHAQKSSKQWQTFHPCISENVFYLYLYIIFIKCRYCILAQSSKPRSRLSNHISTDLSHNSFRMHSSKIQTSEHMHPLRWGIKKKSTEKSTTVYKEGLWTQRDLHLIYNQIPVIWIKAGKPPLDTQKVREKKKEQLKILQGHNLAPHAKHSFIIPKWNSVYIMPPTVWRKVPGNARKWESVYAKKIKEIIWGWGKRIGHTALSPSTFWHLSFPENQATAEQRVGKKWPQIFTTEHSPTNFSFSPKLHFSQFLH